MPYEEINCDCGQDVEIFISIAEDIVDGYEKCDCGRIVQFTSPASESITEVNTKQEVGEVQEVEF